jgi:hypothetical protein
MLKDWWRRLFAEDCAPDPIDHPALRRMSPDELADLPLWPLDAEAARSLRPATTTAAASESAT